MRMCRTGRRNASYVVTNFRHKHNNRAMRLRRLANMVVILYIQCHAVESVLGQLAIRSIGSSEHCMDVFFVCRNCI